MGYFLPYQEAWLNDTSRLKVAEKSRRIGWTYVQAFEDVQDAALSRAEGGMDVWFSSTDTSAAREYILYCNQWAQVLNIAAQDLGEVVIDKDDDIKALSIEFASGFRINAMSSNPKAFRSKGGKVVLDEFAFHEQADELWKAASPSITWGYPMRVFSSHNGLRSKFYQLIEDAKGEGSKWSHHKVTILDAIEDGLVGRINGNKDDAATQAEIDEFLVETRAIATTQDAFNQEYLCLPSDESSAYLPYGLIYANENKSLPQPVQVLGADVNEVPIADFKPSLVLEKFDNPVYLGVDIGRRHDLTVMWLLERVGLRYVTRLVLELSALKFSHQRAYLELLMPRVTRAAIDDTGIGMQFAEEAKEAFGYKAEGVTFSAPTKEAMAVRVKRVFEDRALQIPVNDKVRNDLNMMKRTVTVAGNIRFEGERSEGSHSDRFWALALALEAADKPVADYVSSRGSSRRSGVGRGLR